MEGTRSIPLDVPVCLMCEVCGVPADLVATDDEIVCLQCREERRARVRIDLRVLHWPELDIDPADLERWIRSAISPFWRRVFAVAVTVDAAAAGSDAGRCTLVATMNDGAHLHVNCVDASPQRALARAMEQLVGELEIYGLRRDSAHGLSLARS